MTEIFDGASWNLNIVLNVNVFIHFGIFQKLVYLKNNWRYALVQILLLLFISLIYSGVIVSLTNSVKSIFGHNVAILSKQQASHPSHPAPLAYQLQLQRLPSPKASQPQGFPAPTAKASQPQGFPATTAKASQPQGFPATTAKASQPQGFPATIRTLPRQLVDYQMPNIK
jgi:ABC-type transport system involved in multi-copper enzyme maturation permease subunit